MAEAIDQLTVLGQEEEARRKALAQEQQAQINAFADQAQQRLTELANQQFRAQNPYIIEDAAARGYATSPTELANQQSRYLDELVRGNQSYVENLRQNALATGLQGNQDALEAAMELRRMGFQREYDVSDQARQEALANELARQESKSNLINSLIGAGGNILGAGVAGKVLGAAGAGASGAAGTGGSQLLGLGGSRLAGMAGTGAAIGGGIYGGQLLGNSIFKNKKAEKRARTGAAIGTGIGTIFGPIGSLAGGAIGSAIGGLTKSKPVKAISKAFKKAFCFDAMTKIVMADGKEIAIQFVRLGDMTKGGEVESIRISKSDNRWNYMGTIVTGSHAVKEGGVWKRVSDSDLGVKIPDSGLVYSIVTTDHRIFVGNVEFADEFETDDYEELTFDQSLDALNKREKEVVYG